ncbi:Bug family tripartite tricarboxylate transporter substrate binding protein [Roseomonas marmotae]|uniref:Tripartite tricarboxylate transporter substrate binding protein n=1 Tax=Roseomonas marmotae TaxID=2768161 RepID=A0ABS3KDZ3_9PROT|nr:tripartite tricarboxylate transporter substrate binding protein [Roseomonas marmotae]MBO1075683.1 tripartite tricarboxylate transporter substrate binding protein [Roseomonas marmotae]QTI79541.1 tripartite tricarboxylate transporter substrate binding protein [Roseomonas marmotae]
MLGRRDFARGLVSGALLGAALPAGGAMAQAAPWPDRAPRWVVGYPPGGPSDTFARLIASFISPHLGFNMIVENRPGGGAVLASETVARSAPDGYTLLHADNGNLVYNPALYGRLPYDPDRDLTGVGFIGRFPLFLVVRPESPVQTLADYIAASRQRVPTYGSPAVASPHHLAMEMLKRRAGFEATHVPYRGGPAAMQDLLNGTVDSVLIDCATGIPFLRDGKARGLVVLSETRSAQAPQVPTTAEAGVADAVAFGWQAMSAPAGTPQAAIDRLNAEMNAAMASAEMQARVAGLGVETTPWTPAQLNAFVAAENAQWRPLIRELGIRLDS